MMNDFRILVFISLSWELMASPVNDRNPLRGNPFRLPDHFNPVSQQISLRYDSNNSQFLGKTKIEIEKTTNNNEVDSVRLNLMNLTISNCFITYEHKTSNASFEFLPDFEQISVNIPLEQTHNLNKFTLEVHFESWINGPGSDMDLKGAYWLLNNDIIDGIGSHFQPSLARTVFPTFDEPKFRTVFSLDLDISELGSDYSAFSNERQLSSPEEAVNGIFRFGETKPIPSYLVAFAVLNMSEYTEALNFKHRSMPIRVFIPSSYLCYWKANGHSSVFSAVIEYILPRLETEFEVPWQMSSKLDIAFFKHQYLGMENTGLIFMHTYLLTKSPSKLIPTLVHELVHQWIGGIVVCDWWSNFWINEGLTTYFADQMVLELISNNMLTSDQHTKLPLNKYTYFKIVQHVESNLAINDANSFTRAEQLYTLGSVAAAMLNMAMNDSLMRCLGIVLKNYPYQSLSSIFVMEELTKCPFSDLNATEFMRFWLLADDIPVLKISINDTTMNFSYMYFCPLTNASKSECPDPKRSFEPQFAVVLRDIENNILQRFPIFTESNSQFELDFSVDDYALYTAHSFDPVRYIAHYPESVYEHFFNWLSESYWGSERFLPRYFVEFITDMCVLSSSQIIDIRWLFRLLQKQFEISEILEHSYDKKAFETLLNFYWNCLDAKLFAHLPQNDTNLLKYSCSRTGVSTVLCGGEEPIPVSTKECDNWYGIHGDPFKQFLRDTLE